MQRPPDDKDPTGEEQVPELDDTDTDQLDDTRRFRIVAKSENGAIAFDERGPSHWKWITELEPASSVGTGTFDELKALDNPALSLEDEEPAGPESSAKTGYDPYATGVFVKPKTPSK